MKKLVWSPQTLYGKVSPPGDKSISHRALIFNSIASGKAKVYNLSPGADVAATLSCLRTLGVKIESSTANERNGSYRHLTINGKGSEGLKEPENVLNARNSGTTMRLLTGLLVAQPFVSVITGDSSLRSRPMDRIVEPLSMMGAQVMGRKGNSQAPLAIRGGRLQGIEYSMPVASAQLKSSLLIAGLFAEGHTILHEPAASRDHTERMMGAMGADLKAEDLCITVKASTLSPLEVRVPGDISSAAFWLVAACCHPNAQIRIEGVGVNPSRAGIVEALQSMGARVTLERQREEGGEPVADLVAQTSSLKGIQVQGHIIPRIIDELPVLAVAACFAKGKTVIRDAQELRVKETDRVRTTMEELSKLGAHIEELTDGMVIHGTGFLEGARCRSRGDHRLAMTLGIAGLLARGETIVEGAEAAQVSYPDFWQDLEALTYN